jgi:hypothetical protein
MGALANGLQNSQTARMENPVPVIALEDASFEPKVRRCSEQRRNFIVVGPTEKTICDRLRPLLKLNGYCPECIHRWGIYALSDTLTPDDLNRLLHANREGKSVCIVEQLKLASTKPPNVKPVIVYSEPQGVIADVETIEAAKRFLAKHREAWTQLQRFPLAGIYEWAHNEWQKVRVFV